MKILHIAAHMGGGIGSAYAGLGTCGLDQRIVLLEEPIDRNSLSNVEKAGFTIEIRPKRSELTGLLENADIVLFNWSHHPAVTALMCDFPSIPIRGMLWCHVSGNYFPSINPAFLRLFEQCVFATPFSLELPQVKAMGGAFIRDHFDTVYGLGDLERFAAIKPRLHEGFVVGYVGTLNLCKLHPGFIDYAAAAISAVPGIRFILAGDPEGDAGIQRQAGEHGIADRIEFLGRIYDVPGFLARIDVFGYLLNPMHYGATENALLEALAAGVPVVALNQCVERMIIKDGKTGLLVDSPEAFSGAVKKLYDDEGLRAYLGSNARKDVLSRYAIRENRERMLSRYKAAMNSEKRVIDFARFFGDTPGDWFLSAVGADRDCFLDNHPRDAGLIFREATKGSPRHYYTYFAQDERLSFWSKELETGQAADEQVCLY